MRRAVLVNATRVLLSVGIAVQAWIVLSFLIGPYGLGADVPRFGGWIPEGVFSMHAEGVLTDIPDVDVDLAWTNTSEGATDVTTGLPAVELSGPYTASVNVLNQTPWEQFAYVTIGALVPALAAVVMWVLLRIVSSVGRGSTFSATNAKRMWVLAGLIGIGGTIASFANNWVDTYLIARSAAAPAFQTSRVTFEIWPLLAGLLVGVIALIWDRGIALEKDTEGLI